MIMRTLLGGGGVHLELGSVELLGGWSGVWAVHVFVAVNCRHFRGWVVAELR